jgi:hypothetical protein
MSETAVATRRPDVDKLRGLLEAVLRAEQNLSRAEENYLELRDDITSEATAEWTRTLDSLREKKTRSLCNLDMALAAETGVVSGILLLAGHLIWLQVDSPTIVVTPVEKVVYLDNLRRFP